MVTKHSQTKWFLKRDKGRKKKPKKRLNPTKNICTIRVEKGKELTNFTEKC